MSTQTSSVSLNADYIKSKRGILRICEGLISLCGIICMSQGAFCRYYGMYQFYNFVVSAALILSIIVLIIHLLNLDKVCTVINCFLSIFINDVLFAVLYLVATILVIITIGACSYGQVARIFAVLFGVAGVIVIGLLALMGYQELKSGTAPKTEGV